MAKLPTMRDVASRAGVSIQTVSAVINAKPGITPETTARVQDAIHALGYRPFSVARSLRTRQTHSLGLVVSDIANPVFSVLASIIADAVYAQGYSLFVCNTHNDPQHEKSCIQAITQRWTDGVLFVSTGDERGGLDELRLANIPVVAIDRIPPDYDGPSIILDNFAAGALVADHLAGQGRHRIAHIAGTRRLHLSRERADGFCQRLAERGLELVCPPVETQDWTCASGYFAMRALLERTPGLDAVFAASDRLAIGAMRAIHERGLRIPQDVAVAGVDDIEVAAYHNPPLTTVRQPFSELGRQAVDMLMGLIRQDPTTPNQVKIQPELMARQSTGEEPVIKLFVAIPMS